MENYLLHNPGEHTSGKRKLLYLLFPACMSSWLAHCFLIQVEAGGYTMMQQGTSMACPSVVRGRIIIINDAAADT